MALTRRAWIYGAGAASLAAGIRRPACAASQDIDEFSPDALRAELVWLRDTMLDVGVKPFAYCDEAAWRVRFAAVQQSIASPQTAWSFWPVAAALFAGLNDGHAGVSPSQLYADARLRGLRACPLVLEIRPSGTFVAAQTVEDFPAQTRIVRIATLDGQQLAKDVSLLVGGQHEILRYDLAQSRIPPYLYSLFGERSMFEVVGQTPQGRTVRKSVAATTRSELMSALKQPESERDAYYTFSRLANGRVGYIDYRACRDREAFAAFLFTTFSSIKVEPIDALIIDIRRNGGGNSQLNDDLWSYLTEKPFAQFGGGYEKVSDRLKREYGALNYMKIYGRDAYDAKDGTVLGGRELHLVQPPKNPLRYDGPVYLLIGAGTFSSALSCATAAKDFGLATIVGEETAEPVNSTGEIYSGRTPNVGLNFAFTTKLFLGPKPRPDGQGVLPDVRVVASEDDVRHGRDPVLDYALEAATGTPRPPVERKRPWNESSSSVPAPPDSLPPSMPRART